MEIGLEILQGFGRSIAIGFKFLQFPLLELKLCIGDGHIHKLLFLPNFGVKPFYFFPKFIGEIL